jgi:heat shock protein HslJ
VTGRRGLVASILALMVAVQACGSTAPSASRETSLGEVAGDWQLESGTIDGVAIPLVDGFDVTMTVEAPSIVGTSACNSWGGRIALVDGEIHVTEASSTMKLCSDPVMATETAFMGAIPLVRSAARDGDRLTLVGPGVEMVFLSLEPPPVADLVGPIWRLDALGEGDVHGAPIGDPATLHFDADGSFSGSTGCRSFTGSWIRQTGAIVVTSMSMTGECPADQADQDGFVVAVVGDGFRAQIDGDRLTLTARGSTLLYVTGPAPGS